MPQTPHEELAELIRSVTSFRSITGEDALIITATTLSFIGNRTSTDSLEEMIHAGCLHHAMRQVHAILAMPDRLPRRPG